MFFPIFKSTTEKAYLRKIYWQNRSTESMAKCILDSKTDNLCTYLRYLMPDIPLSLNASLTKQSDGRKQVFQMVVLVALEA